MRKKRVSKETRICIRSPISFDCDKREKRVSKNEKAPFSFLETRILHHLYGMALTRKADI